MSYLWAFLIGGIICLIGQILIDRTKLSPAKILVIFVVAGVILGATGLYGRLVEFAGAGATVPLTGFGYLLSEGVRTSVESRGLLGAFAGGFGASAVGLETVLVMGLIVTLVFKRGDKITK
ncbi:MAG: SpoVA/SpoVAEb family sporulation membrane protein [Oscillospiraceae bacterium]|nr:SpoVA/SpoVAEb family sporulation membrane protein [Oscillospiraceae bacterium]